MTARFGAFSLDADRRQLTRNGDEIHLTPNAFDLLALFVDEAPRVVRKTEIHERLWPGTFVSDATLVSLVKRAPPRARRSRRLGAHHQDGARRRVRVRRFDRSGSVPPAGRQSLDRDGRTPRGVERGRERHRSRSGRDDLSRRPGVSRHHAHIMVGERDAVLEDLGSKNGTKVREKPVAGKVVLRDGDQIHVGPVGWQRNRPLRDRFVRCALRKW